MTVPDESSQDGLVERAQRGDAEAFARLVARHLDSSWRFVRAIGGDRVDPDDVVQEAFMLVWRDLPRLRNPAAFGPWHRAILLNATRLAIRRAGAVWLIPISSGSEASGQASRSGAIRAEDVVDGRLEPGALLAGRERLRRAFGRLSLDHRTVLALHYIDGFPLEEVALVVGRPLGTVKSRLHAARSAFAAALRAEDR
jgi:RNA polymerase sigma-70 factor (ECF subfamily)